MTSRRRQQLISVAAALGGLVIFAWAARRAGVSEIVDGIRRVGWGLVPILALAGLRFVVRAEAWRLCAPASRRLQPGQAFTAFLAGDAPAYGTARRYHGAPRRLVVAGGRTATMLAPASMRAPDIMITEVQVIRADETIATALELLAGADSRHLPVVDEEGELVGMLSDRDLRALPDAGEVEPVDPGGIDDAGEVVDKCIAAELRRIPIR
jgi:hypothetical protein